MAETNPRTSRAEQRRRTEGRILTAARKTFSEYGYERSTIRAIASAAGVNPGLVMHYFGSKERLFSLATEISPDEQTGEPPALTAEQILVSLYTKLAEEPTAELAMLRSMLTHPEATESVRDMINLQQRQLGDSLPTGDAGLRSGLTSATILGVIIGRYLLELDGLRDASPEEITKLLRPCFQSLTQDQPDSSRG